MRRNGFKRRQQFIRIVLHRGHAMTGEQFRKQPQHGLPILQHVGDSGGIADIVFQDVEAVVINPHNIDSGEVYVNIVRYLLAVHLRPEHGVLKHQIFRDNSGGENLPAMINIMNVMIERLDSLLET
jgi:hypothetical protein